MSARAANSSLSCSIQLWIRTAAIGRADATTVHSPWRSAAAELEHRGVRLRVIAGSLAGARSPVQTLSAQMYVDAQLQPGATLELDNEHAERGIFISTGALQIDGQNIAAGQLLVLHGARTVRAHAPSGARLLLIGGAPLDGTRYLWWNFVASTRERLLRAGEDWRNGRFGSVPGDSEFIPLPDTLPPAAPRKRSGELSLSVRWDRQAAECCRIVAPHEVAVAEHCPYERFRALHERPAAFIMPNAWDGASALLLARAGFEALGSSSIAIAFAMGRRDGRHEVSRDQAVANAALPQLRSPVCRSTAI